MAGNFRAEETAWRQMARSASSKIGQRYSSKARFASFQRVDPQVLISVRFETETASFTAKHTPALLDLLGKLKWDQPVEFEVIVGGGTDYYPQCWLVSLSIAGDPGSRVILPANLPLAQIAGGRTGVGVAWRGDGGQFAVGGNRPAIYEAADGKLVAYLPSAFNAAQIKWSPDGQHLAAVTSLNQIKLWNIEEQTDLHTWSVAAPSLRSVAFTPVDGRDSKAAKLVAVAGTANPNTKGRSIVGTAVEVYDLAARKPLDTVTGSSYNIAPSAVDWSPQGRLAIGTRTQGVFASQRSTSKMSDVKTPVVLQQAIEAVRWLPGNHLAAAGSGMLQVWDLDAIKPGQPIQAKHTLVLTTPQFDQAFSHDDRRLVANLGGEVRVWNLVGGATVKPRATQSKKAAPQTGRRQPGNTQPQGAGEVGNPFGPFGGLPGGFDPPPPGGFQPGGFGGRVPAGMGVPQQNPGTPLESFGGAAGLQPGMRNGVTVVAWCPAGDYVAGADYLGQIVIVNVTEDEVVLTLGPSGPNVSGLSWSPRGDRLASIHSDGAVRLWDTSSLPMEGKPPAMGESPALAGTQAEANPPSAEKPAAQPPEPAPSTGPAVQRKEVSDLVNKAFREINFSKWEEYHATLKQIEALAPNAAEIAAVNRLKSQFASKVKDTISNAERYKTSDRSKYLELLAKAAEMDPNGPNGDDARKRLSEAVKSGR
jgi:WD40 repeat protein